eukprot:TRINITY_DN3866_c0_g1_i2.p1 TRINITY_DN3866_c0_g1~~TRINITY_DN3866_c0_g1_i2.p1  ORF type:complete len:216 (-),score=24.10 TRINITY_DN3866_c0_g1_i2:89-679(-)
MSLFKNESTAMFETVDFLAQDEEVEINPKLTMGTISMIGRKTYGPFTPQNLIFVPLWLALSLKTKGLCEICTPEWMKIDHLKDLLKREHEEPELQAMPFHYEEISTAIFKFAWDDVPENHAVSSLLADISTKRALKLKSHIQEVINNLVADRTFNPLNCENIGSVELVKLRPHFFKVSKFVSFIRVLYFVKFRFII